MMYKATVSFSGKVSMRRDEVRDLNDKDLVNDLLKAGYIKPVDDNKRKKKDTPTKGE